MIYVTDSHSLYTDQGEFIKQVHCPLATRLARAVSVAEGAREFNCTHCKTKVKNLAFLSDEEALKAAANDKDVCFFATTSASNVVHVTEPRHMHWLVRDWIQYKRKQNSDLCWPVIRTARTGDEMNFAVANGYKMLFRKVESYEAVRLQLAVYQNNVSGFLIFTNDARYPPGNEYGKEPTHRPVFDYFMYSPPAPALPVAAYVIPPDLPVGTEVFVEDAIEHLICEMPQDTAERMSGWWAVWDGEDLKFLPHQTGGILG
jgi:hypothetical protein